MFLRLSFNSRAREGRDSPPVITTSGRSSFQLTRPRGARPALNTVNTLNTMFQLTRPRGARQIQNEEYTSLLGFNSRAREGRDLYPVCSACPRSVSTHAPARGATRENRSPLIACVMFQLTRPRGARPLARKTFEELSGFQLTRPRGARLVVFYRDLQIALVSTHAPARGATRPPPRSGGGATRFNSRAREGRDSLYGYADPVKPKFQLTRPRGARQPRPEQVETARCFNSRAREGRDTFALYPWRDRDSFNSRAREGRDLDAPSQLSKHHVSTHAPARGATRSPSTQSRRRWFQLTRPRGARRSNHEAHGLRRRFQLTRPRGARHSLIGPQGPEGPSFNSRAREGRDRKDNTMRKTFIVSTHAPARGATSWPQLLLRLNVVSTHAPARGATWDPMGYVFAAEVSTHAPARGATELRMADRSTIVFQLTRPRGARPGVASQVSDLQIVSTHAPARGATRNSEILKALTTVSTHAPARGATRPLARCCSLPSVSTHAPARGATPSQSHAERSHCVSTHAPARGATEVAGKLCHDLFVSTHAPARGATCFIS